jgi:hypothetical protein
MSSFTLSACSKAESVVSSNINQSQLCEVDNFQQDVVAKACTPGQKVAFLPTRFGNQQLPIIFAAVNCDLRYTVALTEGGVTCIYSPIKLTEKK